MRADFDLATLLAGRLGALGLLKNGFPAFALGGDHVDTGPRQNRRDDEVFHPNQEGPHGVHSECWRAYALFRALEQGKRGFVPAHSHEFGLRGQGAGLTRQSRQGKAERMLLYNSARGGKHIGMHLAHAYASGLHVLCCGLPLAAHVLGFSLLTAAGVGALHFWIHAHEWWFLGFSALVFAIGAGLEWRARLGKAARRPSFLLMLTGCCLVINLVVISTHQASAKLIGPAPLAAASVDAPASRP